VITGGLRGPGRRVADARPGHARAPLSVPGSRQALPGPGPLEACWVPGRGYYVRTRFTVTVSGRPRQDGGLTAMLPGGGPRHA